MSLKAACQALAAAHVVVVGIFQWVVLQLLQGHLQASQDIPVDPIRICIRLHFGCYKFRNLEGPQQDFHCQLNRPGVFHERVICVFTLDALQKA